MPGADDFTPDVSRSIGSLKSGFSELRSGISSIESVLTPERAVSYSNALYDVQRALGLSAKETLDLKKNIDALAASTKTYSQISLLRANETIQRSITAYQALGKESDKFLKVAAVAFPRGMNEAVRSLVSTQREIPGLFKKIESGSLDLATQFNLLHMGGVELLATTKQMAEAWKGGGSKKEVNEFSLTITELRENMEKQRIAIGQSFETMLTSMLKSMGITTKEAATVGLVAEGIGKILGFAGQVLELAAFAKIVGFPIGKTMGKIPGLGRLGGGMGAGAAEKGEEILLKRGRSLVPLAEVEAAEKAAGKMNLLGSGALDVAKSFTQLGLVVYDTYLIYKLVRDGMKLKPEDYADIDQPIAAAVSPEERKAGAKSVESNVGSFWIGLDRFLSRISGKEPIRIKTKKSEDEVGNAAREAEAGLTIAEKQKDINDAISSSYKMQAEKYEKLTGSTSEVLKYEKDILSNAEQNYKKIKEQADKLKLHADLLKDNYAYAQLLRDEAAAELEVVNQRLVVFEKEFSIRKNIASAQQDFAQQQSKFTEMTFKNIDELVKRKQLEVSVAEESLKISKEELVKAQALDKLSKEEKKKGVKPEERKGVELSPARAAQLGANVMKAEIARIETRRAVSEAPLVQKMKQAEAEMGMAKSMASTNELLKKSPMITGSFVKQQIEIAKRQVDLQKEQLDVVVNQAAQGIRNATDVKEQQLAVYNAVEKVASLTDQYRRTFEEQFTALSMNLTKGSYLYKTETSKMAQVGPAFQPYGGTLLTAGGDIRGRGTRTNIMAAAGLGGAETSQLQQDLLRTMKQIEANTRDGVTLGKK